MDIKQRIEAANAEAAKRINEANPVLVDIAPAGAVVPGLTDRTVLHSGPPVSWERMCGAQRGAVIGICIFEGWAQSINEATGLLASGSIKLEPNHHHRAVGPMAGTISMSLPVWVVENTTHGNRGYCRNVEGQQQFGDYSKDAIDILRRWRDVGAPSLRRGLRHSGPLAPPCPLSLRRSLHAD
jgi:hypothetical protein